MREKKRELGLYSFYDYAGIAAHLEAMAAQGWYLSNIGSYFWTYRRGEPRSVRYAVTYFPQASEFDGGASMEQRDYQELCAQAGWKLVTSRAQMQIFTNEDPDAVPVETDPLVQAENIHRAMRKNYLPGQIVFLLVGLLNLGLSLRRFFADTVDVLADGFLLILPLLWLKVTGLTALELISYYRWRAGKAPARSRGRLQSACLLLTAALLALGFVFSSRTQAAIMGATLGFTAVGMLFINGVKGLMKRANCSRKATLTVTIGLCFVLTGLIIWGGVRMVPTFRRTPVETYEVHGITWEVYHDEIPLRLEDLLDAGDFSWSTGVQSQTSPLLSQRSYSQDARVDAKGDPPFLRYTIVEVRVPFLYGICKEDLLTRYWYNNPVEYRNTYLLQPWTGEGELYRLYFMGESRNRFLFCWEGRMAELELSWDPTAAQLQKAAEVLRTA